MSTTATARRASEGTGGPRIRRRARQVARVESARAAADGGNGGASRLAQRRVKRADRGGGAEHAGRQSTGRHTGQGAARHGLDADRASRAPAADGGAPVREIPARARHRGGRPLDAGAGERGSPLRRRRVDRQRRLPPPAAGLCGARQRSRSLRGRGEARPGRDRPRTLRRVADRRRHRADQFHRHQSRGAAQARRHQGGERHPRPCQFRRGPHERHLPAQAGRRPTVQGRPESGRDAGRGGVPQRGAGADPVRADHAGSPRSARC